MFFASHIPHEMCLLVELFVQMKMIDLAKRQEQIKEEFLIRMENNKGSKDNGRDV